MKKTKVKYPKKNAVALIRASYKKMMDQSTTRAIMHIKGEELETTLVPTITLFQMVVRIMDRQNETKNKKELDFLDKMLHSILEAYKDGTKIKKNKR